MRREGKALRLNQARIDALVEQLYDINKRLVGYEGRLMRLAESHGVAREDFLKNYQGSELDPLWLNRVSKLSAKGWKSLVARDKDKVKQHRHEIQVLARDTRLEIGAARRARASTRWAASPRPRSLPRKSACRSRRCARCSRSPRSRCPWKRRSATRRTRTSAISSRTGMRSRRLTPSSNRICATPPRARLPYSRRVRSACCACASASA